MNPLQESVSGEFDVVIVGGGIAGLAAARTTAIRGLKTAVIESSGALGREIGRARSMFVDLERHSHGSATLAAWMNGLRDKKGWFPDGGADTCCSEVVFDDLLEEAGVDVWFQVLPAHLLTVDGAVNGIRIASKNGYTLLRTSLVIDASAEGKIARAWYEERPAQAQGGAIHVLYNHVDRAVSCPEELTLQLPQFGEVTVRCRPTFWPGEWRVSFYTTSALSRHEYALLVKSALAPLHQQIAGLGEAVLSHVAGDAWTAPDFSLQANGASPAIAATWTDGKREHVIEHGALYNEQVLKGLVLAGGWLEPFPYDIRDEERTIIQLAQLGETAAKLAVNIS